MLKLKVGISQLWSPNKVWFMQEHIDHIVLAVLGVLGAIGGIICAHYGMKDPSTWLFGQATGFFGALLLRLNGQRGVVPNGQSKDQQ